MNTRIACLTLFILLAGAGCGKDGDEARPAEANAGQETPAVSEDNVFHDQVQALEKAREVEKLQRERKERLDESLQDQEGTGDPPRA